MTYRTHFHTSQLLSNRSRHNDTGMKNIITDVPLKTLYLKLTKKAFRIIKFMEQLASEDGKNRFSPRVFLFF